MRVTTQTKRRGKPKTISTTSVLARNPRAIVVPFRDLDPDEVIVMGFRQEMLTMGESLGGVDVGAGLGSDFIILRWGEKYALVRAGELLRTWVKTFAPDDAAKFPDELTACDQP